MGAWGTGVFENDYAADWVAGLEDSSTIQPVVSALLSACADGYREGRACSVALVAAEIVAAIKGKPAPHLPEEVLKWARSHKSQINEDLVDLALQAIHRVGTESELLDLWQESGELPGWMSTIEDLRRRLGGS